MPIPGSSDPVQGPRQGLFRTPGLVDQHCHGVAGVDFAMAAVADVRDAARELFLRGVTRVVASISTMPAGDLLAAVERLAPLVHDGTLAGLHLEGPFLAAARCGAQSPDHLLDPGPVQSRRLVERLLEAGQCGPGAHGEAGQAIVAMTYAPELDGAGLLEDTLIAAGVLPSPGHTDATAEQFGAAVDRLHGSAAVDPGAVADPGRAPAVTHLFNAMPGFHHRAPGPVPVALRAAARRQLRVELVADGHHVDPSVVVDVVQLLPDAVCVVSDASAATDAPEGTYALGPVAIDTGEPPHLPGLPTLASGAVTLDGALRNLLAWDIPPELAVPAVTTTPALTLPPGRRDSGWVDWNWDGDTLKRLRPGSTGAQALY